VTPNLRDFLVETQNRVAIFLDNSQEPALQSIGLLNVATMAKLFNSSAQFPNCDGRYVKGLIIEACLAEKLPDPRVCPVSLSGFADDVSIDQVHRSASSIDLLANEVCIVTNIGHRRQYVRKATPFRSAQRRLQNLAMSLFGAAALRGCPLFQGLNEVLVKISYH
jgi:hypothetical protein